MRKIILMSVIGLLICGLAFAGQKYNPYTQRWETVPDNWQTQYNPYSQTWSYQPQGAKIEYNPYQRKWDWNSGNGNDNQ